MDGTYLDYNASAPLPPDLMQEAAALLHRTIGNPSSTHKDGRQTRRLIREATDQVAGFLTCSLTDHKIYWTSGASESNSWLFHSLPPSQRVILSAVEHESVRLAAAAYQAERHGILEVCGVDASGVVDLQHLQELLKEPAALVSVVAAHNETGVIQPLEQILDLCKKNRTLFHADCVQLLGKRPLDFEALPLDFASFSGHKIGAPKGSGFLVARQNHDVKTTWTLRPVIYGKQQDSLRGGTENAWAIALTGLIVEGMSNHRFTLPGDLGSWHRQFESELKNRFPGTTIHGDSAPRLPNTTYAYFPEVEADFVLAALDLQGVRASSGSACSSATAEPSKTLLAMGCSPSVARNSIRFSSGFQTKQDDLQLTLGILENIMKRVK